MLHGVQADVALRVSAVIVVRLLQSCQLRLQTTRSRANARLPDRTVAILSSLIFACVYVP
jgi:hypothetical protein